MSSFNRVIIMGNLTRDPDYKQLVSGQAVCRLSIASNRNFKNKQTGDPIQEVCFIDVDVWGAQAESCRQYLQKGRGVLIEGRLKYDTWEDANGSTRSKHIIVADRVIFMASNSAQADVAERQEANPGLNPEIPAEREILNQINQIKNRTQAAKAPVMAPTEIHPAVSAAEPKSKKKIAKDGDAPAAKFNSGEISFTDEPPFSDELPF